MDDYSTHWLKARFRFLSDEDVGMIQHKLLDLDMPATEVARRHKISLATVYRVKSAVPKELVHVDEVMLRRLRTKFRRKKQAKKRAS